MTPTDRRSTGVLRGKRYWQWRNGATLMTAIQRVNTEVCIVCGSPAESTLTATPALAVRQWKRGLNWDITSPTAAATGSPFITSNRHSCCRLIAGVAVANPNQDDLLWQSWSNFPRSRSRKASSVPTAAAN